MSQERWDVVIQFLDGPMGMQGEKVFRGPVVRMGANPLTLMGLAGMGDLVLTCTGGLSRNRRVGLGLGAGKTLQQILDELGEVAEGVRTTRSAYQLAQREGVDMPITEQVYQILYEDLPPADALMGLLSRDRRAERD